MFKNLSLKVIVFGFIFTFFSSFGQSFFLGIFNTSIRNELSITHGQFGSIYASATLLSSFLLIWVGKKIDDINIFRFALYVTLLLAFSCFFFSKISSIVFLFIAVFLMRFSGQGLMSHTATTTISRFFTKSRGKALSIGWFGLSTAEFILPVLIVYLLTLTAWQNIWLSISVLILFFLPFIAFALIKNLNFDSREDVNDKNYEENNDVFKISEPFIGSDPILVQDLSAKFIVKFLENIKNQELPTVIKNQRDLGLDFHFLDLETIKEISEN